MKRFFCIAALFLAACDKPAPGTSGGSGTSTAEPSPREPKPLKPEPVQPRLYVTANGSDTPQIPAGWPLVLTVSVHAPGSDPMKLEAPSGSWASLVHLALPDAAWKPRPLEFAARSITLDAVSSGLLMWTMTPEELDAIPRGTYRILATLEVPESGSVRGQAATVKLVKALPKLTPEQDVERSRLLVTVLRARADAAGAEQEADALLERLPASSGAILLRVDLFEAAGKRPEAVALLDRAIDAAVGGAPTPKNWPRDLARRREELAEKDRQK